MKRFAVALVGLSFCAVLVAAVTVTPSTVTLLDSSGRAISRGHATVSACAAAAEARGMGTYYCDPLRSRVDVTADPPPSPVDCAVSDWSAWSAGAWSACSAGTQSRTETRTRSIVTQPANGGAACPVLGETRTVTQPCTVTPPPTSGAWFSADFTNPNGGRYNFGYVYPTGSWANTHMPTGRWDGGPAAHVRFAAGQSQYSAGWATQAIPMPAGTTVAYIRMAVRFDDDWRWNQGFRNKMVLFGHTTSQGAATQSRLILYMLEPGANLGGSLGFNPGGGALAYTQPAYFGLSGNWSSYGGQYGSISPTRNIGWTAGGPALVSYGSNSAAAPPGPGAAPPLNGWYFLQWRVEAAEGNAYRFTLWANNNDQSRPQQSAMYYNSSEGSGFGNAGWAAGAAIGGYVDTAPTISSGYRIGAFEIGPTFRADWFPGQLR